MEHATSATTFGEAVDWLMENKDKGAECPCCGSIVAIYPRHMTDNIARVLIRMYREAGTDWIFMPSIRTPGQDEVISRHWGLIERMEGRRPDGSNRVGWWRLTPRGVDFVLGRITIPQIARIFKGQLIELAGDQITIRDALGKKFNYDEMMTGMMTAGTG